VVAVPVGVGIGLAAGGWSLVVARKAAAARLTRVQSGAEALCGHLGVVRSWTEPSGQVFVDGALWRARHEWPLDDDQLQEGDAVVVERVSGLTLCVRRADEWELTA
jgi:membrane-bound serine protease (ClpP class)